MATGGFRLPSKTSKKWLKVEKADGRTTSLVASDMGPISFTPDRSGPNIGVLSWRDVDSTLTVSPNGWARESKTVQEGTHEYPVTITATRFGERSGQYEATMQVIVSRKFAFLGNSITRLDVISEEGGFEIRIE